jgi:hypothetical protein
METRQNFEDRLYFAGHTIENGLVKPVIIGVSDHPCPDAEYARTVAEVIELDLPWPNTNGNRPRESLDESRLRDGQRWAKTGDIVKCFPPRSRTIIHYPIAELNP